jgi:hypothetical protein
VDSYFDGDPKERLTVLACGNAAGIMLRPLILYDGKVNLVSRLDGTHDQCLIATNASGYMDNVLFTAYIKEELIPRMTAMKVSDHEPDSWFSRSLFFKQTINKN